MTHTIKSLYDSGQRQFYMRGGGESPVLELKTTAVEKYLTDKKEQECWSTDGLFCCSSDYCGDHFLDLLPIPYADPAAQLERVKAAWEEYKLAKLAGDFITATEKAEFSLAQAIGGE